METSAGTAPGMQGLHPLLVRQLEEAGIQSLASAPDAAVFRALLRRISASYAELERGRGALVSMAASKHASDSEPPSHLMGSTRACVLDMSTLESIRGLGPPGAPDPVIELCSMFVLDMEQRIAVARKAAESGESGEVTRQAHAIKGAAGNFGARRMYAVAKRLQEEAATDRAPAIVVELEAEFALLRELVERDLLGR
jgi:HPt (histidine-containing phosphotransfer) domain-containing protein